MALRVHTVLVLFAITGACVCLPGFSTEKGHRHNTVSVSSVLKPGQEWINQEYSAKLLIDKINDANATFAAFYSILDHGKLRAFPIRGEFDPDGASIGWVVSYRNAYVNDHSLGAWAGYAEMRGARPTIAATRIITHNGDPAAVTLGFDRFNLNE